MASGMFNLQNLFRELENWGLIDVLLPFLLIFVLVFSVLEKTKILGEDKRNLNSILSLIFGLIVVVPHVTGNYPAGFDPVKLLNAVLPSVSVLIVAIVLLLIMIGVFAHDKIYLGLTMPGWIAFFSIVALVAIFASAADIAGSNFINNWLSNIFGSDAIAIVIMLLVFGIIIAFITGDGKDKEQYATVKKLGFNLGELFGGKK